MAYDEALAKRVRVLASMIYVHAPGTRRQADLRRWLALALRFVERLPPK